jgi:transcriptional regulator with XRE-family HTH domain
MPTVSAYRPMPVYGLLAYRTALGLSQVQCARACGLSVPHYQRLEQGKARASHLTLRKLSRGLHVAPSVLRRQGDTP